MPACVMMCLAGLTCNTTKPDTSPCYPYTPYISHFFACGCSSPMETNHQTNRSGPAARFSAGPSIDAAKAQALKLRRHLQHRLAKASRADSRLVSVRGLPCASRPRRRRHRPLPAQQVKNMALARLARLAKGPRQSQACF